MALLLAEVLLRAFFPLTWKRLGPSGDLVEWQASRPYMCRVTTIVWETDFAENATPDAIAGWDHGTPTVDPQGTRFYRHAERGWEVDSGIRGRAIDPGAFSDAASTTILAVGDSFTFGSEVAANESWCQILERTMPGAEVMNGGVPGYGTDQIALKLNEYGPRFKPAIVLWGLVNDDVLRAGRPWFPKSWMPKPQVRVDGDQLQVVPPRTRAQVFAEASGWRSRVGLSIRAGLDVLRYPVWKRDCVNLFRDLMRRSKAVVDGWGGRLVVVYIPTGGPLLRDDDDEGAEYMAICRDLGLEVVDVRRTLRSLNLSSGELAALTLRPNGRGHYSALGNAYVARAVRDYLLGTPNH